ncbi:MAG: 4-(cytidine 5'-diphospho)-2-C-methyl-D-erythritol kinase [Candidatus Omnitrophica bacterium]|nr:4-(cytidine 5'-diphospho)-2-C-methyl-D-erythritol kinase [Candidatus Omnitrophota bacterium]
MEIKAPAKLNLYLKVLGKMPDGYHRIETVFERIALFDEISVDPSESTSIECTDPQIPVDTESLMGKAVSVFRDLTGEKGFKIKVKKNIPVGAGLGGGSSDAAAILTALNELCGKPLDRGALCQAGRKLGADVPFFLEETCFAAGKERGDHIRAIQTEIKLHHVLVNPPFEISTAEIYSSVDPLSLTENKGIDKIISVFSHGASAGDIARNLHNDLQSIALGKFPEIGGILSELMRTSPEGALMSGSGPTVFGIYESGSEAAEAEEKLSGAFPSSAGWKVMRAVTY